MKILLNFAEICTNWQKYFLNIQEAEIFFIHFDEFEKLLYENDDSYQEHINRCVHEFFISYIDCISHGKPHEDEANELFYRGMEGDECKILSRECRNFCRYSRYRSNRYVNSNSINFDRDYEYLSTNQINKKNTDYEMGQSCHRILLSDYSVPVFAMLIDAKSEKIICIAQNDSRNPLYHAEMILMNEMDERYFDNYYMIVTLQPCEMCESAIRLKRVRGVFFGAYRDFFSDTSKSHQFFGGICEKDCSNLIQKFFVKLRHKMRK